MTSPFSQVGKNFFGTEVVDAKGYRADLFINGDNLVTSLGNFNGKDGVELRKCFVHISGLFLLDDGVAF